MEAYGIGSRVALVPRFATAALEASGCALANTADEAFFDIPFKCNVVYAGLIVTVVTATEATVKFDRQNAAGSGTGRTDGTIATFTVPTGTAVGTMMYDKAAQDSITKAAADALTTEATCQAAGGYWDSTTSLCKPHVHGELQPGNQVVVQMAASGGSGNVVPVLVVDILGETMGNLDNVLETA